MKTNIALIGFMGSGKSTAGRILAEKLGKNFIEVDALIEQKSGKSIERIFEEEGEIRFREVEIEVIKEIAGRRNQVIACGGGAVLNTINMDRLKTDSTIIWLKASPGEIKKRTGRDKTIRPLLKDRKDAGAIRELLKLREPFYRQAADIVIETTGCSSQEVAEKILVEMKRNANITA